MTLKQKLKYVLATKNITLTKYAEHCGRSKQSMSRKFSDGAIKASDMIDIGDLTGYRLCYLDADENIVVEFNKKDVDLSNRE